MATKTKFIVLTTRFAASTIALANGHTEMVVEKEENQSCEEEIQVAAGMSDCMMWMWEKVRGQGRYPEGEEEMRELCCNELNQMRSECRCPALRMMMRTMMQRYGLMQQMWDLAENLPSTCRIQSPSRCPMTTAFA